MTRRHIAIVGGLVLCLACAAAPQETPDVETVAPGSEEAPPNPGPLPCSGTQKILLIFQTAVATKDAGQQIRVDLRCFETDEAMEKFVEETDLIGVFPPYRQDKSVKFTRQGWKVE